MRSSLRCYRTRPLPITEPLKELRAMRQILTNKSRLPALVSVQVVGCRHNFWIVKRRSSRLVIFPDFRSKTGPGKVASGGETLPIRLPSAAGEALPPRQSPARSSYGFRSPAFSAGQYTITVETITNFHRSTATPPHRPSTG